MMEGSAIGFRKNPCITVPAVASANPTTAPSAMRGSRSCPTMTWWVRSISNENGWTHRRPDASNPAGTTTALSAARPTSRRPIRTGPIVAAASMARTSPAASPPDHATVLARRCIQRNWAWIR